MTYAARISISCLAAIGTGLILIACGGAPQDSSLIDSPRIDNSTLTNNNARNKNFYNDLIKRGDAYGKLGKKDEALKSYQNALEISRQLGDKIAEAEVTKKITANSSKFVYPPDVISNYIDVCAKGRSAEELCNCFISKAQNIYSLEEFIKINNDAAAGRAYPKELDEISKSCQPK